MLVLREGILVFGLHFQHLCFSFFPCFTHKLSRIFEVLFIVYVAASVIILFKANYAVYPHR